MPARTNIHLCFPNGDMREDFEVRFRSLVKEWQTQTHSRLLAQGGTRGVSVQQDDPEPNTYGSPAPEAGARVIENLSVDVGGIGSGSLGYLNLIGGW